MSEYVSKVSLPPYHPVMADLLFYKMPPVGNYPFPFGEPIDLSLVQL